MPKRQPVKRRDVAILNARSAPKQFDEVKLVRHGRKGLLIKTPDGRLFGATMHEYYNQPNVHDDGMLRALVKLGVIATADIKRWKANQKERDRKANIADDFSEIKRLTAKHGIVLTDKQLTQFRKEGLV